MCCDRCQGLLLREWIHRTREYDPQCSCWWWRCVLCGARVDATILRNRAEQAAVALARRAAEQETLRDWAEWLARVPAAAVHSRLRSETPPPANRWDTAPDTAIAGRGHRPRDPLGAA